MPFVWKSKGKSRKKVPAEVMKNAVKRVLEGQKSVNGAAKEFEIDRKTLGRYVNKVKNNQETSFVADHVSSQIFSDEEEILLERYLIQSSKLNYGLSPQTARKFTYQFAVANNKKLPVNWENNKIASYDWLRGFMSRHPGLSLRIPQATSLSRGTAFNQTTVEEFFSNLKSVYSKHAYGPEAVFNIDESGLTTVQRPGKIIAQRGEKQVSRATSAERGTLVTMCCAVSAIGTSVPPFFIFPRKRVSPRMFIGVPPGSEISAHDSGWMTAENFEKYWLHFIKYTKCSKTDPVVVVFDNHESHITPKGLQICKDNGITLVTLPPHTSHKLQPLDRSVFGPFKHFYNAAADDHMVTHPAEPITIYDIPALAAQAYPRAFNPMNIQKGFACTGIYPLNSNMFGEEDFLGSYVTDRPDPTATAVVTASTVATVSVPNETVAAEVAGPSKESCSRQLWPETASTIVPPEELRPFPKAGARKRPSSRKRVQSRVLTDTPIKTAIEKAYEERQEKKKKTEEAKNQRAAKKNEAKTGSKSARGKKSKK